MSAKQPEKKKPALKLEKKPLKLVDSDSLRQAKGAGNSTRGISRFGCW